MSFRVNAKALRQLYLDLRACDWEDHDCCDWVRQFTATLALNLPAARSRSKQASREALLSICWHLGQLITDPDEEEEDNVVAPADARQVNRFAYRLLTEFGVFDRIREFFPEVQVGDEPLFVAEAWPTWWDWAQSKFFVAGGPV